MQSYYKHGICKKINKRVVVNPVAKVAERELEHWESDTQPERMTTESKLADKFVVFLIDE